MPKILNVPETLIEQKALVVNRKDITAYTVQVPLAGTPSIHITYLAREMDAAGNPINGITMDAPALADVTSVNTAMAVAGTRVILSVLSLLTALPQGLRDSVAAAVVENPTIAGTAYYEGTKAALYEHI